MRKPKHQLAGAAGGLGVAWLLAGALASAQPAPEPVAAPEAAPSPQAILGEAVDLRGEANAEQLGSQQRIEELSDATDTLLTRYQSALRQYDSLRTYNEQMEALIQAQEEERASLEEQLDRVELVSRDVTPLMLRMIGSLEAFLELDMPFLEEERRDRIRDLRVLMNRADVTESEKYRRIMEAYQVENEYGRTIEAYRSTLEKDGKELTVDFLRVGRIALVYQTLDESEAGVWNQQERRWDPLDDRFRSAIRSGLRIARKQSAPDLIRLPLPPPAGAES